MTQYSKFTSQFLLAVLGSLKDKRSLDDSLALAFRQFGIRESEEGSMKSYFKDRFRLIERLVRGMADKASHLYHTELEMSVAATAAVHEFKPLMRESGLGGEAWEEYFHSRICSNLAHRSNAVQRRKKDRGKQVAPRQAQPQAPLLVEPIRDSFRVTGHRKSGRLDQPGQPELLLQAPEPKRQNGKRRGLNPQAKAPRSRVTA